MSVEENAGSTKSTEVTSEPSSDESRTASEKRALEVMRDCLPEYIVKCLTVAGFDTVDVLSKMDVSGEPGDSIHVIEEYVAAEYPELLTSKSKKFPPGHRIRIKQFVEQLGKPKLGKRQIAERFVSPCNSKRSNSSGNSESSSEWSGADQVNSIGSIRRQVSKWQRNQNEDNISNLKENEHFIIAVTPHGAANIRCLVCSKNFQLGKKKNTFLISNWTRHIATCIAKPTDTQSLLKFDRISTETNNTEPLGGTRVRSPLHESSTEPSQTDLSEPTSQRSSSAPTSEADLNFWQPPPAEN